MDTVQTISALLTLLAGIGVFLTACGMMTANLEALGSDKLRDLFSAASRSKLLGVSMGALGTAAIQSSGATTVIVIGFVNAGIMSLVQAATVIYGANIGTTITGQIVAWGISGEGGLSSTVLFSGLAGLGAFITSFASKERAKTLGGILCGFGLLFVGLSMMSGAMEDFAELDAIRQFLASISNRLLLVVIGAALTAVIQSSSVMTSVAITMVVAGLITLDQGIYLTMGSNIGSCVVSIVAGLTGTTNARRASYIHLIFNVVGVVVFMLIGQALALASHGTISFGTLFDALFPGMPQVELAMFHTVFNVLAVLLILPFTNLLVALVTRLVPEEAASMPTQTTFYIDDNLLGTPPIAVQQVKNEIVSMAGFALRNFEAAIHMVQSGDFSDLEEFDATEEELDHINREVSRYVSKLLSGQLSVADSVYLSDALRSVTDLELAGDYAERIVERTKALYEEGGSFSEVALADIDDLANLVGTLFAQVVSAYEHNDEDSAYQAMLTQLSITDKAAQMSASHVRRVADGICSPDAGTSYLANVSDIQRVGAHFTNLAKTI